MTCSINAHGYRWTAASLSTSGYRSKRLLSRHSHGDRSLGASGLCSAQSLAAHLYRLALRLSCSFPPFLSPLSLPLSPSLLSSLVTNVCYCIYCTCTSPLPFPPPNVSCSWGILLVARGVFLYRFFIFFSSRRAGLLLLRCTGAGEPWET